MCSKYINANVSKDTSDSSSKKQPPEPMNFDAIDLVITANIDSGKTVEEILANLESGGATFTEGAKEKILEKYSNKIDEGLHDFKLDIGFSYLDNEPILGAIHMPELNETFIGENGRATVNGETQLTTSQVISLDNARVFINESENRCVAQSAYIH